MLASQLAVTRFGDGVVAARQECRASCSSLSLDMSNWQNSSAAPTRPFALSKSAFTLAGRPSSATSRPGGGPAEKWSTNPMHPSEPNPVRLSNFRPYWNLIRSIAFPMANISIGSNAMKHAPSRIAGPEKIKPTGAAPCVTRRALLCGAAPVAGVVAAMRFVPEPARDLQTAAPRHYLTAHIRHLTAHIRRYYEAARF
jgi:hypothetical protein